jgi:hypothetical protein
VPTSSTPAAAESGMARFSLHSAILTSISIIFGIIVAYLFASFGDIENVIRKSGGTKEGLGFAIFAVVVWPIWFIGVLILFSLSEPMPGSGGSGIPTSLAVLLAGISLLLASFVMIRGLRRRARGVEEKDGQRHFPGLTGTVLATLGLAILGPVLAVVIPSLFPASESHDRFAEIEREIPRVRSKAAQWEELAADPDSSEDVPWRLGKPEVTISVAAHRGFIANRP